jgi:glycosyltransferase involved in cell wall biosynthesis
MLNIPRESWFTRRWLSWHHRYLLEQLSATATFLLTRRWRKLDIFHVADPDMALQMHRRTRGSGLHVIYKDGLLLGSPFCRNFDYVQVLAPYYAERAAHEGIDTRNWFVIPHLIDSTQFQPSVDKSVARRAIPLKIARDSFVVLAVGDFSPASNKRLEWIVDEVARLSGDPPSHLILIGQSNTRDFNLFERDAVSKLGGRVHLFRNLNRDQMVRYYQAADVFAHAALREPFGIVFLEAMASGLPLVGHHFPVTKWIIGEAGTVIDMEAPGKLAATLESWKTNPELRRAIVSHARKRAVSTFDESRIIPLYQAMYDRIMTEDRAAQ